MSTTSDCKAWEIQASELNEFWTLLYPLIVADIWDQITGNNFDLPAVYLSAQSTLGTVAGVDPHKFVVEKLDDYQTRFQNTPLEERAHYFETLFKKPDALPIVRLQVGAYDYIISSEGIILPIPFHPRRAMGSISEAEREIYRRYTYRETGSQGILLPTSNTSCADICYPHGEPDPIFSLTTTSLDTFASIQVDANLLNFFSESFISDTFTQRVAMLRWAMNTPDIAIKDIEKEFEKLKTNPTEKKEENDETPKKKGSKKDIQEDEITPEQINLSPPHNNFFPDQLIEALISQPIDLCTYITFNRLRDCVNWQLSGSVFRQIVGDYPRVIANIWLDRKSGLIGSYENRYTDPTDHGLRTVFEERLEIRLPSEIDMGFSVDTSSPSQLIVTDKGMFFPELCLPPSLNHMIQEWRYGRAGNPVFTNSFRSS